MASEEELLLAMKTELCVYDENFRNLHQTHELHSGEGLTKSIEFMLRYPPYNRRRQQVFKNSDQVFIDPENIKAFCKFLELVLKRGGYGYVFCSVIQFAPWWRRLKARTEDVYNNVGKTEVYEGE